MQKPSNNVYQVRVSRHNKDVSLRQDWHWICDELELAQDLAENYRSFWLGQPIAVAWKQLSPTEWVSNQGGSMLNAHGIEIGFETWHVLKQPVMTRPAPNQTTVPVLG